MTDTAIIWFRTDLRLHDNEALARGVDDHDVVVPIYCFDPREFDTTMFDLRKTGPYRARFLVESVRDLKRSLRERGGDLLVRHGLPEALLPEIADEYGVETVYYHTTPSTEERTVETAVTTKLEKQGVDPRGIWGGGGNAVPHR